MLNYLKVDSKIDEEEDPNTYDGSWGHWMPMTNCLLLSSDREKIDSVKFADERDYTDYKNTIRPFGDNYTAWVETWKAVEDWQKPENWTVPSDWLTVGEMEQENKNRTSDFYVAQFRIRFCIDDL